VLRDQMTPKERMEAYNKGQPIDRLPCVPIVGNTAARVINVKVSEFKGNGKLLAKAHVAAYRMFGYDIIRVFTDLYVQAEAMGAKVHYPYDQTAYLEAPAINDVSEIDSLEPADPYKDGNLPHHLEAMKIVAEEVGDEVTVAGAVTCPFTNASFLIGAENLVRLTLKDPEKVHRFKLRHAKIIAFGSTRRVNVSVQEDANVKSLLKADTPAVAIFGKSWDFHVTDILKTTLDENLRMIF